MSLNLRFREELVGAHHGQQDLRMLAYDDDAPMGYVDYTVFEGELFINYIEVVAAHQRRGIGRALMAAVAEEWPGVPIIPGMTTDEGTLFMEGMRRNPEPAQDFIAVYDDRGLYEKLELDTSRTNFQSPSVRNLLVTTLVRMHDDGATAVQLWQDGRPEETLYFRDFDMMSEPGLEQFYEVLFGALDDIAPPPRSGVRQRVRPNRQRRRA